MLEELVAGSDARHRHRRRHRPAAGAIGGCCVSERCASTSTPIRRRCSTACAATPSRPLLQVADPAARLTELSAEREPLYREAATLEIETRGRSLQMLVDAIVRQLPLDDRAARRRRTDDIVSETVSRTPAGAGASASGHASGSTSPTAATTSSSTPTCSRAAETYAELPAGKWRVVVSNATRRRRSTPIACVACLRQRFRAVEPGRARRRRAVQDLGRASSGSSMPCSPPAPIAARPSVRARRRRGRRPRRLRRRLLHARHRLRPGADHPAGAGRFVGRRQDGGQPSARQEPDRRVSPAALGRRRPGDAAPPCRSAS